MMIQNNYYKVNNKLNKKIALFADIHYSDIFNLKVFDKIIVNLKDNKPDFICIPGDLIDDAVDALNKSAKKNSDIGEIFNHEPIEEKTNVNESE